MTFRSLLRLISFGALCAILTFAFLPIVWMNETAPRMSGILKPEAVAPGGGYSYNTRVSGLAKWPYSIQTSAFVPEDLTLTEAGRPLGPLVSYAGADNIANGRYVFAGGDIRFSATDNSDPRTNGRSYAITLQTRIDPTLEWLDLIVLLLGSVFVSRRKCLSPNGAAALAYSIPASACLVGFIASTAIAHSLPLVFWPDSYGYLFPGMSLASGHLHGVSIQGRGIGYPALIAATLMFAGLRGLSPVQLGLSVLAVALLAATLFELLRAATARLVRSSWYCASELRLLVMSAASLLFVTCVVASNGFAFQLYSMLAEVPHLFLISAALLLFVACWLVPAQKRIPLALGAFVLTYFSTLTKPMTLITLCLAGASLLWIVWAQRRTLTRRTNLSAIILSGALVGAAHAADSAASVPESYLFGPETLFCNHIEIVLPAVGEATPERAELSRLLRGVLARNHESRIQVYNGDDCSYDSSVFRAIGRAAAREHSGIPDWLLRQFLVGVAKHPLVYIRLVAHQLRLYFRRPLADADENDHSPAVSDAEWNLLKPYTSVLGVSRDSFSVRFRSWVPKDLPAAIRYLRNLTDSSAAYFFTAIVLPATLLATLLLLALPTRQDRRVEVIVTCIAGFASSWMLLIAMAHTFDEVRYQLELLPLAGLWFVASCIYLIFIACVRIPELHRLGIGFAPLTTEDTGAAQA